MNLLKITPSVVADFLETRARHARQARRAARLRRELSRLPGYAREDIAAAAEREGYVNIVD